MKQTATTATVPLGKEDQNKKRRNRRNLNRSHGRKKALAGDVDLVHLRSHTHTVLHSQSIEEQQTTHTRTATCLIIRESNGFPGGDNRNRLHLCPGFRIPDSIA